MARARVSARAHAKQQRKKTFSRSSRFTVILLEYLRWLFGPLGLPLHGSHNLCSTFMFKRAEEVGRPAARACTSFFNVKYQKMAFSPTTPNYVLVQISTGLEISTVNFFEKSF